MFKKKRILLVDDHLLFLIGLKNILESRDRYNVEVFNSGLKALELLDKEIFDLVILDIHMPEINGIELLKKIKKTKNSIKVLMLTMDNNEGTIIEAYKAGCNGYLLKGVNPDVMFEAIDNILQKGFYSNDLSSIVLMKEVSRFENSNPNDILLDERDRIMINLMCTEMSYKEIADKMNLSPKTIDNYRASIFRKLGVNTRVGIVIYAMKNNLHKDSISE